MSAAETLHRQSTPRRHRFTVESFHAMGRTGILAPDARIELIEGELFEMSPIGSRHAGIINRLNRLLVNALQNRAIVSPQGPLHLDEKNELIPDLAVLATRDDDYISRVPRAGDVLLLIEVADTTLSFDRTEKARLYARSGIPEYWVIDIDHKAVLVHRSPNRQDAIYTDIKEVVGATELRPGLASGFCITAEQLFA